MLSKKFIYCKKTLLKDLVLILPFTYILLITNGFLGNVSSPKLYENASLRCVARFTLYKVLVYIYHTLHNVVLYDALYIIMFAESCA